MVYDIVSRETVDAPLSRALANSKIRFSRLSSARRAPRSSSRA